MAAERATEKTVTTIKAEYQAKIDALTQELQQCKIESVQALQAAERSAHEADKVAAAELRTAEQEISRLCEELAKIQPKSRT